MTQRAPPPLALTVAIFALAFSIPAWPWLSGAVTVPYDAKSTFLPPVEFMARAFATGESPLWTPNVFAGWPNVADPQSMLTSPLHVLLALVSAAPGFRPSTASPSPISSSAGSGSSCISATAAGMWRARSLRRLPSRSAAPRSARLQHTGQVISLAYLPIAFWLLSRALDRSSWRYGAAAGTAAALIVLGRDQVALLEVYVLAGFVLAHWLGGEDKIARVRASLTPLIAGGIAGLVIIALPVLLTELLALRSNRPEFTFIEAGRGSLHWTHLLSLVFADLFGAMDPTSRFLGRGRLCLERALRHGRPVPRAEHGAALFRRARADRAGRRRSSRGVVARDPLLHHRAGADRVLHVRLVHAGVPRDVRGDAGREAVPPSGRRDLRVRRADRDPGRLSGASLADRRAPRAAERRHRGLAIAAFILAFTFWLAATTVGLAPAWKPIVTGLCFVAAGVASSSGRDG